MDPVLTITAFGAMAVWISLIVELNRQLKDCERKAIDAICEAVDETKKYIAITKPPIGTGKTKRDRSTEIELANLWRRSSDLLYQVDYQLAERCSTKSAFWENPRSKKWKQAHTKLAKIKLKDISREASKLRRST